MHKAVIKSFFVLTLWSSNGSWNLDPDTSSEFPRNAQNSAIYSISAHPAFMTSSSENRSSSHLFSNKQKSRRPIFFFFLYPKGHHSTIAIIKPMYRQNICFSRTKKRRYKLLHESYPTISISIAIFPHPTLTSLSHHTRERARAELISRTR